MAEGIPDDIYEPWRLYGLKKPPMNTADPTERRKRLPVIREYLSAIDAGDIEFVPVVGTVGKGSTAAYLSYLLSNAGKVGTLVSPHVYDFGERVMVSLKQTPNEVLLSLWDELRELMDSMVGKGLKYILSFQEAMLLMAAMRFSDAGAEYAIVEAARGGGSDPVNALDFNTAVLTAVDYDHTHIFGRSLIQIAREKAGIMRPGLDLYTAENRQSILSSLRKWADEAGTELHVIEGEPSGFMARNARLAAEVFKGMTGEDPSVGIDELIEAVRLPGRREIRDGIVLDIAHNPVSLAGLRDWVAKRYPRRVYLFGCAEEKNAGDMVSALADEKLILVKASYRGMDTSVLSTAAERHGLEYHVCSTIKDGLRRARAEAGPDGVVVVTGSTFLVADVHRILTRAPSSSPS